MKFFKQPFYGWWIVAAGGLVQWYTSAIFWRGFQAFVPPILGTFGWSHGLWQLPYLSSAVRAE